MKALTDGGGTGLYTADQLAAQLVAANASIGCRFEVLDRQLNPIGDGDAGHLTAVDQASLDVDPTRLVPASLKLRLLPDPLLESIVSPFQRFIRPWWRLRMPDGGIAEWPQGVYVWTQPAVKSFGRGAQTWDVVLGDLSHLLSVTGPDLDGYVIASLTNATAAIGQVLQRAFGAGVDLTQITQSDAQIPAALFWTAVSGTGGTTGRPAPGAGQLAGAPATSWQDILRALHTAIGYQPPSFDWLGAPVARPFPLNLFSAPAAYTFTADADSILEPGAAVTPRLDLFANRVMAYANNASANAFQGNAIADANDYLPGHPWSQAECDHYVTVTVPNGAAGDARTLLASAVGELFVRMAVVLEASIETQMWPTLESWDVLSVELDGYSSTQRFLSTARTVDLLSGRMKFKLPKITGT